MWNIHSFSVDMGSYTKSIQDLGLIKFLCWEGRTKSDRASGNFYFQSRDSWVSPQHLFWANVFVLWWSWSILSCIGLQNVLSKFLHEIAVKLHYLNIQFKKAYLLPFFLILSNFFLHVSYAANCIISVTWRNAELEKGWFCMHFSMVCCQMI